MRLFKFKKGNWSDIFVWIGITFFLMVSITFLYYINDSIDSNLLNISIVDEQPVAKAMLQDRQDKLPFIFDFIFPVLFIGFLVASGFSARKILSSHMFTPVMLFISPILIMFGAIVEIVWDKVSSGANAYALSIADLTITNIMLSKFIFFVLIYIFVVGVSLYTKDN